MLPATNKFSKENGHKEFKYEDKLHVLGILYMMEVIRLEIDGLKVTATRFIDLQEKLFISSCLTDLNGPPRVTKHHGEVSRPQVA